MGERTDHTRKVFAWLNQIKRDRDLEGMPVAFLVAYEISQHINHQTGQGFPGTNRIATNVGIAESTVRAAVDRLEAYGHLEIERGRGRGHSHRYRMTTKPQPAAVLQEAKNRSQLRNKTAASEHKTAASEQKNRSYPAPNNLREQSQRTIVFEQGRESAPKHAHTRAQNGVDLARKPNPHRLRKQDMREIQRLAQELQAGKITEEEAEQREAIIQRKARARPDDDWPDDYRKQFWEAYPAKNRVGEKETAAALARLRRKKRGKPTWAELIDGIQRNAIYCQRHDLQMPNPKNWLAGERWNDRPGK
jgi:DNA-binding transcriptional regulator YhcF (GntR family)